VLADTNVQTWNAEQALNYGDNEHLRLLNFNDATLGGVLGEKYAGNQSNRDAKLGLLSFDLGELAERVRSGELLSANLVLTYSGPAKFGLSGTNTLVAARATPGWVEGDGKTTPPSRANTIPGGVTWLTKPTIDTSVTATSAPFNVTAAKNVGTDSSYSNSQVPIGVKAVVDILPLLSNVPADSSIVSFAVNETKKQDLTFVSREGAARNPNAAGMAPRLELTFATQPEATATAVGRCVAGSAHIAVTVRNNSDESIASTVTSTWGSKSISALAAGKATSLTFATRSSAVAAGTVDVNVTGKTSGASRTFTIPQPALNCGG
jgi:hypothetical protein